MTRVLVINAGSSSLKYALIESESGTRLAAGSITRIGEQVGLIAHDATNGRPSTTAERVVTDHEVAIAEALTRLEQVGADHPDCVGHRVVHGGERFSASCLIDRRVIEAIADCVPLAPLHNPACLAGIEASLAVLPGIPQVAVFDTAFHTTIPPAARTYAIDLETARQHRLRRYGFHGTSHEYVSRRAARFLGRPLEETAFITLHLGNGASACAVRGGRSVDTSMGVTPLEGLVMGTRCGDIDPSIPEILGRAGWAAADVDELLNHRSGLTGLCGANDMREVHARADEGDEDARLARDVYAYRIRKYVGAYLLALGGADAIVFTAGVGEHDAWTREQVCRGLEPFGIAIDPTANGEGGGSRDISTASATIRVLVIPTDEEHAIAEQTAAVVG